MIFEYKKQRHTDKRAAAETDELPFGQIQKNLGLDSVKVFGD